VVKVLKVLKRLALRNASLFICKELTVFIYSVTKAKRCDYTVVWQTLIIILSSFYCFSVEAATVTESLKVIEKTNQISINSQKKIDQLSVQTQRMLEEYQRLLHNTEYQDAYNQELSQLKIDQDVEINSLQSQRNDIKVTQMRIMPLMRSMADALERFVILDLPFKQQERVNGVMQLKQRLRSPSLSIPEKYRLILEAFQIEIDYGRTIEAYRDSLNRGDESISV
jgi:hypothetical protein